MKNRLGQLDLLRLMSIFLVMFGHYVMVGGGALTIPGIIGSEVALPLINSNAWSLWKFESFLIEKFSTQTAILGVSIFFVITGYLMPMMLERYTRAEFLANRFFRIFPVLFCSVIAVGLFLNLTQDISFPASSYVASWSLSYLFVGLAPVIGVLWTLVIEVIFYFLSFLIGKFSVYRLMLLQTTLLAIILASLKFTDHYHLMLIAMQAKYLLMITIGSSIFLAEKEELLDRKAALILGSSLLSYLGFQIYKIAHNDTSTYANLGTHALAVGSFLIFQSLGRSGFFARLPKPVYALSDLVYPIYLLHAAIGLGTMALVRNITSNPYVMLFSAIAASFLLSYIMHLAVERRCIIFGKALTTRWSVTMASASD